MSINDNLLHNNLEQQKELPENQLYDYLKLGKIPNTEINSWIETIEDDTDIEKCLSSTKSIAKIYENNDV